MKTFKEYVQLREYGSDSMEWSDVVEKVINDMKHMPTKPNVRFFSGYLEKYPQVKDSMRKIADEIVRQEPYTNQIEKLNFDPKLQYQFSLDVIKKMFAKKTMEDSFVKYGKEVLANEPTVLQKIGATAKNAAMQTGKGAVALGKGAIQTGKEIGQGLATGISKAGDHISTGVDMTKAAGNAYLGLFDELSTELAKMDAKLTQWGNKMAKENPHLKWMGSN